jgi:hypothetical protein
MKNSRTGERERYMWGWGLFPHPHIYPIPSLVGALFSGLIEGVG